jgi:predicted enzyme involved in methoxymalonyl-ACP biosynthesis
MVPRLRLKSHKNATNLLAMKLKINTNGMDLELIIVTFELNQVEIAGISRLWVKEYVKFNRTCRNKITFPYKSKKRSSVWDRNTYFKSQGQRMLNLRMICWTKP